MKKVFLVIFSFTCLLSFSQETENKKPFSGKFDLGLSYTKNKEEIFQFNNVFQLKYETKKQVLLFNNNISFINKSGEEEILNKGNQNIQYSFKTNSVNSNISIHHLYDISRSIKRRWSTGVGFSANLLKKVEKTITIGLTGLKEFETTTTDEEKLINRLESACNFSFQINKNVKLEGFSKFQPNVDQFSDYRLNNYLSVRIKLNSQFLLSINNIFNFDSMPEEEIPNTDYQMINSISYTF